LTALARRRGPGSGRQRGEGGQRFSRRAHARRYAHGKPTSRPHRRPLDHATEPRMVAARLTDRRRFRGGGTREAPSLSSPPDVQMCHLSDPTGFLLWGTRQDGLQRARTPGGVEHQSRNCQLSSSGYGASHKHADLDGVSVWIRRDEPTSTGRPSVRRPVRDSHRRALLGQFSKALAGQNDADLSPMEHVLPAGGRRPLPHRSYQLVVLPPTTT
jgi:hypothetical protein